ncbi:MBL fold metallo-hydrolase [Parabacteroides sp. APC149_11_2_Y6]
MALNIHVIENQPINSNCFVLFDSTLGNQCIIVDPGTDDCEHLLLYLNRSLLIPNLIIVTHEHFDHIAGIALLRKYYNFVLLASEECSNAIQDSKSNLSFFNDGKGFVLSPADQIVKDGESLGWNGHSLQFYVTPGHTNGGISILVDDRILFTGDTLIYKLKTVTKLPFGSKEKLKLSYKFYKSLIPQNVHVYAGHGIDFDLSDYDFEE